MVYLYNGHGGLCDGSAPLVCPIFPGFPWALSRPGKWLPQMPAFPAGSLSVGNSNQNTRALGLCATLSGEWFPFQCSVLAIVSFLEKLIDREKVWALFSWVSVQVISSACLSSPPSFVNLYMSGCMCLVRSLRSQKEPRDPSPLSGTYSKSCLAINELPYDIARHQVSIMRENIW